MDLAVNSCNGSFENIHTEFGFFHFMYSLISMHNRLRMKELLYHGFICYNHLRFDLMDLFIQIDAIYATKTTSFKQFSYDLNAYVNSYLLSVIKDAPFMCDICSLVSQYVTDYIKVKTFVRAITVPISFEIPVIRENANSVVSKEATTTIKCTDGLTPSFLHKSDKIDSYHQNTIENVPPPFEIPASNSKTEVVLKPDEKGTIEEKQLSVVNDFPSFLSPLEQDYTKSSKGYCLHNKSKDEMKLENNCDVLNEYNIQITEDTVHSDEFVVSDDEHYDPSHDKIISKYFDSLQSFTSDSDNETSYNQILDDSDNDSVVFEDIESNEVQIIDDSDSDNSVVFAEDTESMEDQIFDDSDSDNSVVFFEDVEEGESSQKCNIAKYEKKTELCFPIWHDDDDDVEFHEQPDKKSMSKASIKNVCGTKSKLIDSESFDDNVFHTYDVTYSSSSFESFNLNFRNNNKELKGISYSFSQSKTHVYAADFEGFINPCFEDDDDDINENSRSVYLKSVNDKWENAMQDVSSEPRHPQKISFSPEHDLVSVKTFEPDNDGYKYSLYVLDQVRFKSRISEFEQIINPYLSPKFRANVYQYYYSCNNAAIH